MTPILKRLVAISLSVIMALTLFPLIGGAFYGQTAFADDEIVQDDGDVGGGDVVNEEEPEVLDENAPDGEAPDEVIEDEAVEKGAKADSKYDDEDWEEESIYFAPEDESDVWDLYSDGNRDYTVSANYEGVLEIMVGTGFVRDEDAETVADWKAQFGELLSEGTYYEYDDEYGNLTLYGGPIYDKIKGTYNHVTVAVVYIDDDVISDYSLVSAKKTHNIKVKEPYVEYDVEWSEWSDDEGWVGIDEPKGPITMLEGVNMAIYEDVNANVYNASSPNGDSVINSVTDVTVSDPIIEVDYDDWEEAWVLSPVAQGEATITAKIDGLDGEVLREYDVTVAGERVVVNSVGCKGNNEGVPGESVEMRASAFYESTDYSDFENLTFRWWIDEDDTDVAEIAWDEEDSSKATVTFKKVPLNGDNRYITVWAEATYINEDGDAVVGKSASRDEVFLRAERYEITPTSEDIGLIDIGQSIEYTPQLYKVYYNETVKRDLIEDAEFEVYLEYKGKYNKKKKKWTHKSWWATDHKNGTWTIKRYDGHYNEIEVYASAEELDEDVYEYYNFATIRTNLSKYQIKFVGAEDYYGEPYYCIDNSNAGITPEIVVYDDWYAEYEEDAYVVPPDQYTVKVEKLNKKNKYVSSKMPLKFNKNEADPGSYNNGEGIYRVYVTAKKKNSHGFTKSTSKYNGIVLIYSDHTLTPVGGDVQLPNSFNQFKNKDLEGRYDLPLGVSLAPEDYIVMANAGNDTLTPSDYKVQYRDWRTPKVLQDEFPTETGTYDVVVTGQGAYYGLHDWNLLYIGEKNTVTVSLNTLKPLKAKTLKKKAQTVTPLTVTDAVGDVTYSISGNSKLKINKTTGKVTVKKKTKKGTYKAWITVHANGDETYAPEDCEVQITIKVK